MRDVRCERISRSRKTLTISLLLLGCVTGWCTPARATQKFGPLEISGNIESQNLIRNPSENSAQFVQNRNTFRLRIDYDWLQNGKLIDRFEIPFIERSKLFLLYRGVYDGFYDLAPGDLQRGQTRYDDLVGGPISGNRIGQVDANGKLLPGNYSRLTGGDRTADKWENTLREAYIDLKIKDAPLSFRIGRQQVIWGESDQFRIMDIWNPLDTSWHFQQESWDNIRVPLWLMKGLWDIGQLGPLSNTFFEVVYNAFDFQPGIKAAFNPRPWGLPFPDPLRTGQVNFSPSKSNCPSPPDPKNPCNPVGNPSLDFNNDPNAQYLAPQFNLQGTSYFKGDFQRNPQDASEVGTRFHFVTPQGVEMSANYLYGRGRGVGAASPFGVKIESINLDSHAPKVGSFQPDPNNPTTKDVIPIYVNAKIVDPYMHIFGLTGNYFEGDYTQTVFRMEMAYAMGEPFQSTDPNTLACVTVDGRCVKNLNNPASQGFSPLGFVKRDVWTGMLGFDRPTWIKFLNPRATWFLSGQFFWNYTTGGRVDQLRGTSGAGEYPYFGPVGKWVSGPFAGQVERMQVSGRLADAGNGDQVRRWEHLITTAATSFYRGGTVVPFVANAWDPVNDNDEILWNIDYYYTNNMIFSLQQKFFFTYGSGAPSNDPWYAGGRFSRRDETGVKVTYQF